MWKVLLSFSGCYVELQDVLDWKGSLEVLVQSSDQSRANLGGRFCQALNISQNGNSTTLDSLFQGLTALTGNTFFFPFPLVPCRTSLLQNVPLVLFDCTPPRRVWLHLITPTWQLKTATVFSSSPGQVNPAPSAVPCTSSHPPTMLVAFCLTCSTVSCTEGPKLDTLLQM